MRGVTNKIGIWAIKVTVASKNTFCFPAVRTIHRRKARDQCTKSATRDKLSCDAERREQDIDRNSDNQTNDGNYMTVLPRGQINCADVVNLIFLTRTILVQVPHDEQLDREQNSHCVQIVDRVGRTGIARLDQQEGAVAYNVEHGDYLRHILRDALEHEDAEDGAQYRQGYELAHRG